MDILLIEDNINTQNIITSVLSFFFFIRNFVILQLFQQFKVKTNIYSML